MNLQPFIETLGLTVDTRLLEAAVRERGFEGAQFVAVALAAAAFMEIGEQDVERAIDSAIEELEARRALIRRE